MSDDFLVEHERHLIIPIKFDRSRNIYIIEIVPQELPKFQKTLIDGMQNKRINVFFTIET